jgi:hypothetical protein
VKLTWQELTTIQKALEYYSPETCTEDDRIVNLRSRLVKKIPKVKAAALAAESINAVPTPKEPEE